MGYILTEEGFQSALKALRKEYRIFAPVRKKGAGRFTDIDAVIYRLNLRRSPITPQKRR